MLQKIIKALFLCTMLSFFTFPVSFTFLPETLNTKMVLAVFGVLAFGYDCVQKHSVKISHPTLFSTILAIVFSVWCYYCITVNGTDDTTYARYWLSFATWFGAAYGVCWFMRVCTGKSDLENLTLFLSLVCVIQCVLAIIIDNNPSVQRFVDHYFNQGQVFLQKIDRLYGIGANLDPAGVRFSVVLLLMGHQMSSSGKTIESFWLSFYYFAAYAIIVLIGSVISRTTWVGAIMGILYMTVSYFKIHRGFISKQQTRFWFLLGGIVLTTVVISMWFYNHNPDFRQNLRFGFEGFFNWAETGVFRTDSTDKMNLTMWVWPSDTRPWIIGTGLFDNWVYGTDIGYCRFTLYCGLIGLIIFSIFFIFNGVSVARLFPGTNILALFLIALTFIIWLKVSTDIFFVYALLFSTHALSKDVEATYAQSSF